MLTVMREKELRLALVCYGGISLAIYMHGVTKEIWHVARASRAQLDDAPPLDGVAQHYRELLQYLADTAGIKLRVFADIVAGASAGGINGIFLARALASGESLEPLTKLWMERADVTVLLDPDARPLSRFSKFWAVPIAWMLSRAPRNIIDTTVERGQRAEVRAKLSQFVRARWFAPPFGGELFCNLLLDAIAAMEAGPKGPALLPADQPIDLMVTATDFAGYAHQMRLNSPPVVEENEHRLLLHFRQSPRGERGLDDGVALAFAARATASFPGAFPPFSAAEMDRALAARGNMQPHDWPQRNAFLAAQLCKGDICSVHERVLIDGSVLANAPFKPAIAALRQRPARREVDRRFVYIDPKPGRRAFSFGDGKKGGDGAPAMPGFFGTILRAMSDIPREQPIRDNVEAIENLSARIRRMRHILDSLGNDVDERVAAAVGRNFFLDRPTPARLAAWRAKAQARAAGEGGYAFAAYGHVKLSLVVEDLANLAADLAGVDDMMQRQPYRAAIWGWVRGAGVDQMRAGRGENPAMVAFFRDHDIGYRVRRMRLLARRLDAVAGADSNVPADAAESARAAIYRVLGLYLDRDGRDHYADLPPDGSAGDVLHDPADWVARVAGHRALAAMDAEADILLADAFNALPVEARRAMITAYLGFPFYDAATLPLLQGEGDGEFDPIKIDRISPEDAVRLRSGGAAATLKGIQFNAFGAFFSRAFRENDYLWGRLHAAERLFDIIASSAVRSRPIDAAHIARLRDGALDAILVEEAERLGHSGALIAQLRVALHAN